MKKIILIPNPNKDEGLSVTKSVVKKLISLDFSVLVSKDFLQFEKYGASVYDGEATEGDLVLVIGGDGSIIDASRVAIRLDIPLLGINLGRVGYLSEIEAYDLDSLSRLKDNDYSIEYKMLLSVDKYSPEGGHESSCREAVNDVVISHGEYLGIADFKLENSYGDKIVYRADGLILSTPAGSTAYSLSAGGPVVAHDLDSITVTPVCPHSFFNRSIIYGKNECIKVSNSCDSLLNISVDGRFFTTLAKDEWCVVKRSTTKLKMLTFSKNNMFAVLFEKIKAING
ncbi:MAG: NAD(+)/NADH kinase [Clostridia bacterium]|nr:NAD(+)/NADH kinase [Clostridia bacterium]